MTLPKRAHDARVGRQKRPRSRAGIHLQGTFCPFGNRECRHFYLDMDAAFRKEAYCPRCRRNSEGACLQEQLRATRASKEVA